MKKTIKKIVTYLMLIALTITYFIPVESAYASETKKYVKIGTLSTELKVRYSPSNPTPMAWIQKYQSGSTYEYLGSEPANSDCVGEWYKINYGGSEGYVCSDVGKGPYLEIVEIPVGEIDLSDINEFPASYRDKLLALKQLYPKWEFIPINTGLDFDEAANRQSKDHQYGSGLINTSNEGWRSVSAYSGYNWKTDYWPDLDGKGWKAANKEAVGYYMDPRNFLTESEIFQFEELYQNPYVDESVVQYALRNTFMIDYNGYTGSYTYNGQTKTYSSTLMESAATNRINPLFLATRVRQEVVLSGGHPSGSVSGKVSGYEGYYNFFNIGAYAHSDRDAVTNGLIYAKSQGWNNPYISITQGVGGTLITDYIKKEAQTRYFQKYNVNPKRWQYYGVHTQQYMTNIQAPYTEGLSAYYAYNYNKKINANSSFRFLIPVFDNMPEKTVLPNTGNPNYYLKDLTINGNTIDGFTYNKANYSYTLPISSEYITIDGTTINSNARISGSGRIKLNSNNETLKLKVTAQNGNEFTYNINVVKKDVENIPINDILDNSGVKYNNKYISGIPLGTNVSTLISNVKKVSGFATIQVYDIEGRLVTDSAFKTGYKVRIGNTNESKEFEIILYGDLNGDGEITKVDLLLLQRHIFGYTTLTGVSKEAANIDKKSDLDKIDLLLLQRHVFGYANIAQ